MIYLHMKKNKRPQDFSLIKKYAHFSYYLLDRVYKNVLCGPQLKKGLNLWFGHKVLIKFC